MDEQCNQIWQKLSTALKPQVSADTFKRWFSGVRLSQVTDDAITLLVPNNIYQFWIESNHMSALQSAIETACDGPRAVKFALPTDVATELPEAAESAIEVAEPEPSGRGREERERAGVESAQYF